MVVQQAVAKRFVGRRVDRLTCLFFDPGPALRAFASLRDVSLRCSGLAALSSARMQAPLVR
jgi:hypothetical protein